MRNNALRMMVRVFSHYANFWSDSDRLLAVDQKIIDRLHSFNWNDSLVSGRLTRDASAQAELQDVFVQHLQKLRGIKLVPRKIAITSVPLIEDGVDEGQD